MTLDVTTRTAVDREEGRQVETIFQEAKRRFDICAHWESIMRARFLMDYMFAHGDPDNGYQWFQEERDNRFQSERPCLTVNKVRQHNFNIINDIRQNKPAIKFMATGNGATFEAAQVWTALARHIEYMSNSADAVDTAVNFMVTAGWGYMRGVTDYENPRSFRQQLKFIRVKDPFTIYQDPDACERDKSDSKYAFIFEEFNKDEFDYYNPKYAGAADQPIGLGQGDWVSEKKIRTAEYFRIVPEDVTLWEYTNPRGEVQVAFEDELSREMLAEWKAAGSLATRSRPSCRNSVEWNYLIGTECVETQTWPGTIIPIVPFIAEEIVIQGQCDRKSHTRALKDPQRIYNYYTSAGVEFGALQTKTPWLAPAEAIDGLETQWNTANAINRSLLTFNAFDEAGQPLPPPQRIQPPVSAPLALEGTKLAAQEMAMVSGQYDAQMGAPSNERSGKAINERQRQGDRATYQFIDATGVAIRLMGRIMLDVVPRLYTQKQVLEILAESGESLQVMIDPTQAQALQQQENENGQVVAKIFNPGVGQYAVMADVGPGYATRREETFNAMVLLLTQAPQLAGVIGDLLFKSGDFLFADEAAARLRRMIPPQALGQGPSAQEQQLMQQVQQLQQLLSKTMQEYAGARIKLKGKDEKRDVDIYNAYTTRIKALADAHMKGQDFGLAATQLLHDIMSESLEPTEEKIKGDLGESSTQMQLPLEVPPHPGAQKASDGHWYVKDVMRPGRWMKVVPTQPGGM